MNYYRLYVLDSASDTLHELVDGEKYDRYTDGFVVGFTSIVSEAEDYARSHPHDVSLGPGALRRDGSWFELERAAQKFRSDARVLALAERLASHSNVAPSRRLAYALIDDYRSLEAVVYRNDLAMIE